MNYTRKHINTIDKRYQCILISKCLAIYYYTVTPTLPKVKQDCVLYNTCICVVYIFLNMIYYIYFTITFHTDGIKSNFFVTCH